VSYSQTVWIEARNWQLSNALDLRRFISSRTGKHFHRGGGRADG